MVREPITEPTQRWDGDQQVADFQRSEGQQNRFFHREPLPAAVLFDRDNTLVVDVPYNGNPDLVELMPGAKAAVELVRAHGVAVGVISNQSGIGRGIVTAAEVEAVNQRVRELLGPFEVWEICPHTSDDGCQCRKPKPGMLLTAAEKLAVSPAEITFIGDIGADIGAAAAAGCRGILVPTSITRVEEVAAAETVCTNIFEAVQAALGVPREVHCDG